MEIKPVDLNIKTLLESDFYKIPRFQRPYSWDRENVSDFWNDAVVSDVSDYFIGSFVVYATGQDFAPLHVVDGQQRLTTITLILAAVRDAFDGIKQKTLAEAAQKLIERNDLNGAARFVVDSESPYPFLQEHIQKHGAPQLDVELGAEEEALKSAYDFFKTQVGHSLATVDKTKSLSTTQRAARKSAALQKIRDRILRLQLIRIRLSNEDDAHTIFETLNTRGKDLTTADLVKNHLLKALKPKNAMVDVAREKWDAIRELFDESPVDIDLDRFLYHAWLSRQPYVGERQLFKRTREYLKTTTPIEFLDTLGTDAVLYRDALAPKSDSKTPTAMRESLRALQVFRVAQPAPALIALLRAYRDERITQKQARQTLHSLENFHFQFTAMTAQRTGGGTARMYALFGRELHEAKTTSAIDKLLKAFVKKLRARVPTEAEFRAGFERLRFAAENTKQRPLVFYALRRIDVYQRGDDVIDYSRSTIEHIAPQKPASGAPLPNVGLIGNLTLLTVKQQEEVGNGDYAKKKPLYKSFGINDVTIDGAAQWSVAEIDARTQSLAKLAYSKIFKV